MYFDLLNATVLFLGIAVAALSMGRVALSMTRGIAFKQLKKLEESVRAEAQRSTIAAVCHHAKRCLEASAAPKTDVHAAPAWPAAAPAANDARWGPARLRTAGYTTPELVTSLAVVAILAGVSVPEFSTVIVDTRAKTAAVDVYTTMVYARSEAIKRNTTVDVIPAGGNWKNGWTVQAGATVLKTVAPSFDGLDDVTAPGTLTYGGDGRLTNPGTVTYTIGAAGNPKVTVRRVIVDTSGRPSIRQGA